MWDWKQRFFVGCWPFFWTSCFFGKNERLDVSSPFILTFLSFFVGNPVWFSSSRFFHPKTTLQGTNISPKNGILMHFEDDFPFPKVGYVNSLEGIPLRSWETSFKMPPGSRVVHVAAKSWSALASRLRESMSSGLEVLNFENTKGMFAIKRAQKHFLLLLMGSGQIIATSHDRFAPKWRLVREIPLFQGNVGWWTIIIWPDGLIRIWICKNLGFWNMIVGRIMKCKNYGCWQCFSASRIRWNSQNKDLTNRNRSAIKAWFLDFHVFFHEVWIHCNGFDLTNVYHEPPKPWNNKGVGHLNTRLSTMKNPLKIVGFGGPMVHMGVSWNGGTPKTPQNDHF